MVLVSTHNKLESNFDYTISDLKDHYLQEAHSYIMSLPSASPEEDITMIGQRHADRYPTVRKDFVIDQLDNSYGLTSLV